MGMMKHLALKIETGEKLSPDERAYLKFLKNPPKPKIQMEFDFKESK